ncbi:MAG: ATP-binding protein [Tenacibaculum sp.]
MNLKGIYKSLCILLIVSFNIQFCINKKNEKVKINSSKAVKDSIASWIKNSKKKTTHLNTRKEFLIKAYQTIKSSTIDTLEVRHLSTIAYQNLKLGDTLLFKKRNKETLAIANKLKDTFAIGDAHWNYASYYNDSQIYDSAYYHFNLAYINFNKSGYLYESAKTQYGMAYIKGRFKDYLGSEVLTISAINKFKKIKNYKSLFTCYNHLGTLQKNINEYDQGLFYYNKAIKFLDNVKNNQSFYEVIYNNIGNIYLEKKEYTKAINYYSKVLANKRLKSQKVNSYARALDNRAYCKFLMKDTVNVVNHLNEALHIRDSLNNKEGVVISKIHLSEYYAFKKDTSTAINYIKEANSLAKDIKSSRDYLKSLSLLSKLDSKHSLKYLKKHIQFSDSIQIKERKIQNKFARVIYETDKYMEENKRLSQQKIWISITSFGLILILGLAYFLKNQKFKNEKLLLENEQQKTNEQVYLLTLKQQEKLEKEKIKERKRISEELHDGILGKLFGTRIELSFFDIKGGENLKEQYQLFLKELKTIEKEIREVSHKLSTNFDSSQISFATIVLQLIESKCNIGNFKYELDFDEHINWQGINEKIKVNLYKIIQEALQNIIKYAYAKKVSVTFLLNNKDLVVIIKDEGIGFNTKKKRKGIGLKNMTSRIEKLNGIFNIHSKPNEGTTIKIKVPI